MISEETLIISILEEALLQNPNKIKLGIIKSRDLTSAFYMVYNWIMMKKLKYYRVTANMIKLLESYLTQR